LTLGGGFRLHALLRRVLEGTESSLAIQEQDAEEA
jgi:hypothetical protein